MLIMDAHFGKINSKQIGEGVDACAFDAAMERAYSSDAGDIVTHVQNR